MVTLGLRCKRSTEQLTQRVSTTCRSCSIVQSCIGYFIVKTSLNIQPLAPLLFVLRRAETSLLVESWLINVSTRCPVLLPLTVFTVICRQVVANVSTLFYWLTLQVKCIYNMLQVTMYTPKGHVKHINQTYFQNIPLY